MKTRKLIGFSKAIVLAAAVAFYGCGGGGGGSAPATTPTTNATATSNALFTAAADPVNVIVTTDSARAASQIVTTAGATLNATAADGSQFTLVIPANAVLQDTTITMTPISSVTGLPLTNGLVAGVQFTPDGLFLEKEATLTIVPAVTVPVINQTFLGYLSAGNDLHLVPPASPSAAIQMKVGHFSGMLLGNGISADRAALYLKRAADHQARLEQEAGRYLSEARQKALLGVSDENPDLSILNGYFDSYYGLVVRPRLLAASSSCENADLALKTLLGYERQLQLLGGTGSPYFQTDMDTVSQALSSTCAFKTSTVTYGDLTVSSQTICKLEQPFNLAMGGQYSSTFNFIPTNKISGTVSYSGTAATFPASGSGTYGVTGLNTLNASTLTLNLNDCITIPLWGDSCKANTLSIPLQRLDHGC